MPSAGIISVVPTLNQASTKTIPLIPEVNGTSSPRGNRMRRS
jgi:hypothetical protein